MLDTVVFKNRLMIPWSDPYPVYYVAADLLAGMFFPSLCVVFIRALRLIAPVGGEDRAGFQLAV